MKKSRVEPRFLRVLASPWRNSAHRTWDEAEVTEKDAQQLDVFLNYLQDLRHADRQRERHLPTEVRTWLDEADKVLGNDPES